MLNTRTDEISLVKYVVICTFILTLIDLVNVSGALAQWPTYGGYFFGSSPYSFNTFYRNSSALYPATGSGSRSLESYGNYVTAGIYGQSISIPSYVNLSPSISFSFPGGLYGGSNGGLFAGVTNYNTFSPSSISSPFTPSYITPLSVGPWPTTSSPWQGVTITPNNSWTGLSTILPMVSNLPVGYEAAPAPQKLSGEWESLMSDDLDGNPISGELNIDRSNSQKILNMSDSSLPLGEGTLTQFTYTPTQGKAPISFKAQFDSGYIVTFSGTSDNFLHPLNAPIPYGDPGFHFNIEGEYVIKDSGNQTIDKGKFTINYKGWQ